MKQVIFWTVALISLFYVTSRARAGDVILRGGSAVVDGSLSGGSKVFGLRYEDDVSPGGFNYALEGGGYVDNLGGGRKSAGVVKAQLGITPGPMTGTFAKLFTGPCFVSATDAMLGSNYQFCTDAGLGIRDGLRQVAVVYSHISNAGLALPNRGRDFVVIEAGVRF